MQYEQIGERHYAIRIARNEEVISSIETFCTQEKIRGAFFNGIGAVGEVELAHYNVDTQKYSSQIFNQPLEVTQLSGNVSTMDDKLIIHTHGTFSDTEMKTVGGHVVKLTVSGTMEISLIETSPLTKAKDAQTGLNLLDLSNDA